MQSYVRETETLEEAGWSVTRLATLQGCDRSLLEAVVWRIQQKKEEFAPSQEGDRRGEEIQEHCQAGEIASGKALH